MPRWITAEVLESRCKLQDAYVLQLRGQNREKTRKSKAKNHISQSEVNLPGKLSISRWMDYDNVVANKSCVNLKWKLRNPHLEANTLNKCFLFCKYLRTVKQKTTNNTTLSLFTVVSYGLKCFPSQRLIDSQRDHSITWLLTLQKFLLKNCHPYPILIYLFPLHKKI